MLIERDEIARVIPHAGDMCLLDGVMHFDTAAIQCLSTTHRALDNPLRRGGQLGVLAGVEYAAQAMALHAALVAPTTKTPRGGYLASLRAVTCHTDRLDLVPGPLLIEATQVMGDSDRMIYRFAVRHEARLLLDGRAAVVLRA